LQGLFGYGGCALSCFGVGRVFRWIGDAFGGYEGGSLLLVYWVNGWLMGGGILGKCLGWILSTRLCLVGFIFFNLLRISSRSGIEISFLSFVKN